MPSVVGSGNPGAALSKMNQGRSFDVVAAAAEGMSMPPFHELIHGRRHPNRALQSGAVRACSHGTQVCTLGGWN